MIQMLCNVAKSSFKVQRFFGFWLFGTWGYSYFLWGIFFFFSYPLLNFASRVIKFCPSAPLSFLWVNFQSDAVYHWATRSQHNHPLCFLDMSQEPAAQGIIPDILLGKVMWRISRPHLHLLFFSGGRDGRASSDVCISDITHSLWTTVTKIWTLLFEDWVDEIIKWNACISKPNKCLNLGNWESHWLDLTQSSGVFFLFYWIVRNS